VANFQQPLFRQLDERFSHRLAADPVADCDLGLGNARAGTKIAGDDALEDQPQDLRSDCASGSDGLLNLMWADLARLLLAPIQFKTSKLVSNGWPETMVCTRTA
jgi:hypothetical protein